MVLFGFVGWVMKRLNWPRPPLILGLVLGSIFERYYFISSEIYGIKLFTRPIVIAVLLAALWVVLGPTLKGLRRAVKQGRLGAGLHFRIKRLDHHALFTMVLIVAVVAAIWTASDWAFGAKLMPMTAACAALFFSCLVLINQVSTHDTPTHEFIPATAMQTTAAAAAGMHAHAQPLPRQSSAEPRHEFASNRTAASASAATSAPGLPDLLDSRDDERLHAPPLPISTVRARGLRFFLTIGGALALAWMIGLLPALFLMMLLLARFEFAERWRNAVLLSVAMTLALWLVFDLIFATPWPPSLLGDYVPALRGFGGLI
jgi:hypothetical protein